ncbi:simple sugar transport system substrate-binding protein/ribose transport system substrate-binding protein [Isoptericola jiangsuensis]|uniref:Simple sugar transport system substrate-binding protein/ribose transport system substrate-binding protein n=1 Tax=Isoptericola jiangsuensis TaxID=548579 RepID=A0A2A9EW20_9MICO|nr:ABC transporter substrate-binding protein [Isoptericola jiangsuensis]PFG42349.1 simple sugar transport system substrate-binding protein/ribose transport system substrate-binding protein [Isoptericola jiangsuensis]
MARSTFTRGAVAALSAVALLALGACSSEQAGSTDGSTGATEEAMSGDETIAIGFSQVGAESGWRAANTKSIQDTLTAENGFDLSFSDAQQKQENQIQAIRSYIAQGVDVIAFSPVVETGWDPVLQEAKSAGIPVILTDRAVDSEDDTLYESFIGSDFVLEGEMAGEWAAEQYDGEGYKVVELQGTTGSAPAIDRKEGFGSAIEGTDLEIIDSQTGNFTRTEGKQVMEGFLQKYDDIDLVFAHNDDMGLGAIEAIEAAGLTPGEDIKIITIDAVKDGMTALSEGKINYIVECNPLLGPDLAEIAQKVVAGEEVEKRIVVKDEAFDQEAATEALPTREY